MIGRVVLYLVGFLLVFILFLGIGSATSGSGYIVEAGSCDITTCTYYDDCPAVYVNGSDCYYNFNLGYCAVWTVIDGEAICYDTARCRYDNLDSNKPACDDFCSSAVLKVNGSAVCDANSGWVCSYQNEYYCFSGNNCQSQSCGGSTYYCTYDGSSWAWRTSYPAEVCGDNIDNDCDGRVDEVCCTAPQCYDASADQCVDGGTCQISGNQGRVCDNGVWVDIGWFCLTDTYPDCASLGLAGPYACPDPGTICIDGAGSIGADWCGIPESENFRDSACFNDVNDDNEDDVDCYDVDCAGVVNPNDAYDVCCQTDSDCPVRDGTRGYCDSPNGAKGTSPYSYKCFWPPCTSTINDCASGFCCTYEIDGTTRECVQGVYNYGGVSYLCDPIEGWSISSEAESQQNLVEQFFDFIQSFFQR